MARKLQVTVLFEPSDNITPEITPPTAEEVAALKAKRLRQAGRRPKDKAGTYRGAHPSLGGRTGFLVLCIHNDSNRCDLPAL